MARRLLIVGLILAAVLLATALIWPLVQQAQMETPLADVVSGVQRGKVADIAACFTPDASAVATLLHANQNPRGRPVASERVT